MKNHLFIIFLFVFVSCTKKETVDLSRIDWIQDYNFQQEQVHKINITGMVPAPKIPFTIEGITKNCILSLGTYDLVLNEKFFDLQHFEPYRLSNKQVATRDMLFEEGVLDSVAFLDRSYDDIRTYLMKNSDSNDNFAGIIGWQFLQSQIMVLDMKNSLVGLKDCDQVEFNSIDFFTSQLPSQNNSMLKFKCELNGEPIMASICTSIRHSFISPEFLNSHDIKMNNDFTTLDTLKVGDMTFTDFTCFVNKDQLLLEPDNKTPIDLIIGLNEIKKCLLVVDFCTKKIGFINQ